MGNYQVTAGEVCVAGFCSGGTGPVEASSAIRLRGLSITCGLGNGACADITISFGANSVTADTADAVIVDLGGNLSASAVSNVGYFAEILYGFSSVADTDVLTLPAGDFRFFRPGLTGYDGSGFSVSMSLTFALDAGQTLSIPDGFDIRLNDVPEPGTALLVGSALAAAAGLSRRRR